MELLSYQKDNLRRLEDKIKDFDRINIIAPKCSGVKTVIDSLDIKRYIVFDILPGNSYPFMDIISSLLKNHDKLPKVFSIKFSPSVNIQPPPMPVGVGLTVEIRKNNPFSQLENSIKKQIKKILKSKNIVFVLVDDKDIDQMSRKLIEDFRNSAKRRKNNNRVIVLSINNKSHDCENLYFDYIKNQADTETAIKELNLNPKISLSNDVISFIDKNISADVGILKDIVESINNNKLDIDLNKYDTDNIVKKLIDRVISSYKYGNAVQEILSILAISGESFNEHEFGFLLNKDPMSIKMLLDFACDRVFINNKNGAYRILFDLLKQMFSATDDLEKKEIYKKLLHLIDTYYPDNYEAKYKFAKYANDENCEIFLLQNVFADIRAGKSVNINSFKEKLSKQNFTYLEKYLNAVVDLRNNNFNNSTKLIDAIANSCFSPIKQEFAILLSQNLIKSIDNGSRIRAIDLLSYNKNDNGVDNYLQYRLDTRTIAAYIHNGNYKAAREASNILENDLIGKIKLTDSPGLKHCLNILYRKYSYIHSYESSSQQIKMSVEYFDKCHDVQAKYIALNNLMAIDLINGNIDSAEAEQSKIEDLVYKSCNVHFHRNEIYKNNELILKHLQRKISNYDLCNEFENLYHATIQLADNILIASNYAIALALNSRIDEAIAILRKKENIVKDEREGIYAYRVNGNLAIFLYIKNHRSEEPQKLLDSIKLNQDDIHTSVHNKQIERLKTLINNKKRLSLEDWTTEHAKLVDSPLNYLRLYERPFIYTALFDWDDE